MTLTSSTGATAVLAALVQSAGCVEGRVRLQKLTYLLHATGLPELSQVRFRYHHYGPYSDEVAHALTRAVLEKAILENSESFDDQWQRYSYMPGTRMTDTVLLLSEDSRRVIAKVVKRTTSSTWRALELAATIDYLTRFEELTKAEAENRALLLKVQCQPFREEAKRVLQQLGLS